MGSALDIDPDNPVVAASKFPKELVSHLREHDNCSTTAKKRVQLIDTKALTEAKDEFDFSYVSYRGAFNVKKDFSLLDFTNAPLGQPVDWPLVSGGCSLVHVSQLFWMVEGKYLEVKESLKERNVWIFQLFAM